MVRNDVAECSRLGPLYFGHQRYGLTRQVFGCLSDNLEISNDGIEYELILSKLLERHSACKQRSSTRTRQYLRGRTSSHATLIMSRSMIGRIRGLIASRVTRSTVVANSCSRKNLRSM